MKKITLLICSLFVLQGIFSQGIYESYIIMDVNGGGNTYYDLVFNRKDRRRYGRERACNCMM